MRTLAFVTQKGGSGKSTLASSLDVEAGVAVAAVTPAKLGAALAAMEKDGVTLAIIDTPGASSAEVIAAMKAADLCIIPARPNVFDLWASDLTRKTLKTLRRDYAFLKKAGVSAIFGPGTNIPAAAAEILSLIRQQRLAA